MCARLLIRSLSQVPKPSCSASIKNASEMIVLKLSGDRLGATVIMDHTKVVAKLLMLHCFLFLSVFWRLSHLEALSRHLVCTPLLTSVMLAGCLTLMVVISPLALTLYWKFFMLETEPCRP